MWQAFPRTLRRLGPANMYAGPKVEHHDARPGLQLKIAFYKETRKNI
jgi:hypothetical protein